MAIEQSIGKSAHTAVEPETSSASGRDLLARIAGGSEAALASLYRNYHPVVYAFSLRRLGNPADAAEVLNEVMMEVWRHARCYEGRATVRTWLLGICRHKVIDQLRRRARQRAEPMEGDPADPCEAGTLDLLVAAQESRLVRRCLNQLSDAHRQVVRLAFFEELSYTEIAAIAGCPEGTVKTRMFHAKQQLRRCLADLNGTCDH